MDLNLRDKVAVITGGTVGIGLAVAEGLAAEGANLVLVGRDRQRGDDEAARLAEKHGIIATAIAADVATAAGCDTVISGITMAFGGVDILINNAGTGSNETIAEADDAKWQYYWDLHVMAAVRLARGLVPAMKKRGGGVVLHNASICAVQPLWYEPIYNTTKAALMMFSKTLANEVLGDNIRVNTINPGLVLTPDWIKTAREIAGEDGWQAHLQGVADEAGGMKRFATPAELANFFVFMCSDRASYSTGSTYFVDGGWLKTV
ncbi:short-chain dehydrogenase [Devosia sp. Root436]|uniref:SDR family NAD(P)-dependent oxidoreductase n=1 Tax=Devosia sp. Root436 TaxID=1736537 RepID=UPI0006FFB9B0|nr:SDR family oxidoreductase [Devosia sp. Root436]KQX40206.1 short-chain dehydrogenase [Devosia sp. Root436]